MANHKKTQKPRKQQHHLPKVGSPANDAYRQKHGREDLLDFGLMHPGNRTFTRILGALAVVFIFAVLIAFIALT